MPRSSTWNRYMKKNNGSKRDLAQMRQLFRDDEDENNLFVPLIIKASQAGALETLLTEATKIIN